MPYVLGAHCSDAMRWDRLRTLDPGDRRRGIHALDTTTLKVDEVADHILIRCRRALRDEAPDIRLVA